jgi:hypothetical protein
MRVQLTRSAIEVQHFRHVPRIPADAILEGSVVIVSIGTHPGKTASVPYVA